jgi:iron complex outermembrane recepter protein
MRYFLPFIFILSFFDISAQNWVGGGGGERPAIGKIHGTIINSVDKKPVEFATVSVFKDDSVLVTGTITGQTGTFEIPGLRYGRYKIKIDFLGFQTIYKDSVSITPQSNEVNMGQIKLAPNSKLLNEFTITGEKELMQLNIEKKVFNVEKSIVSEGGSATDLLQQIPSVTVDIDGNINMRGSGNITVLIDGKPSGLTGSDRNAVLSQLPANSIESVEIISNPSAKYDPDGMSGIINIILKKNKRQGKNGNISVGAGTRDKYNGSFNYNQRTSKLNIFTGYSYRYDNRFGRGLSLRENIFPDTTFFLDQKSFSDRVSQSHIIRAGSDYYINDKNTIGFSTTVNFRNSSDEEIIHFNELSSQNVLYRLYDRDNMEMNRHSTFDGALNYKRTFTKPRQELTFDFIYSGTTGFEKGNFQQQELNLEGQPLPVPPGLQKNNNKGINHITTVQADYVHPFENQSKFETGAKSIIREIDNDFFSTSFDSIYNLWVDDVQFINHFIYRENINSVYGTYTSKFKSIGYHAGLRAEQTYTTSRLLNTDETFNNDYFNLFPTLHLSHKPRKENEIQLSYSRRINRPSLRSLNPFTSFSDPLNLSTGSPFLTPEYTNSYEISYAHFKKKNTATVTAYYRQTNNIIQRIRSVRPDGVAITTFENLASATNYGFELITRNELAKWWNITSNFNFFRTEINGRNINNELSNANLSWFARVISNFIIAKGWHVQVSGMYRAPTALAQGMMMEMYGIDAGFRKDVLKNNASISFNISDIFDTRQFEMSTSGHNFNQDMLRKRETRVATLTFTWKFGSQEGSQKQRKRKDDSGFGGEDFGE